MARRLDPRFNVTPTIRLLSDLAVRAVRQRNQRDIVNTPPRTGKSKLLAVWLPVWALGEDPDMQIVIISNGDDLAQEHSREVREIIREHSGFLGYRIAQDKTAVGRWRVEGRRGGMLAAGINSGVVGFGADLMIIDDPVKDAAQADSAAHRRRVLNEYQGSLSTRVHPGGSVFLVMTRWHQQDLAGSLLELEPDRWRATNVPAVSEPGVPDALGRPPGVTMVSALGFTPRDFEDRRRSVGERMWWAQYQGVPSSPEGGLVKREWLNAWRLKVAPQNPVLTVVGVDPSDSGSGDACGLVAASLMPDGVRVLIADKSAPMTSDEWARAAVDLAVEVGASEIAVEAFAARETYTRVVREALRRARVDWPIRVSGWPPKGRARVGDAVARSSALLQGLETGMARLAGYFPDFEEAAVGWLAGRHQPDSLAALVVADDVLLNSRGRSWELAAPVGVAGGSVTSVDDWMRRKVG
ncbi:hypothetical protein H7I62_01820 [Mycolicibacterium thermoresistibile]|nr:hypothetical protein [Mycolicibacterium thermoresistibile]